MANSKDRQDILDKFDLGLAELDEDLIEMDEGEFREWTDTMTAGIACLARDSLEAKARKDREMDNSCSQPDFLDSDSIRVIHEKYIKNWQEGWQTTEIRKLRAHYSASDRPRLKKNFGFIANAFLRLGWFLVSAGPA